jgi:hypothetical protein
VDVVKDRPVVKILASGIVNVVDDLIRDVRIRSLPVALFDVMNL